MSSDKIRCYEIEPHPNPAYDTVIVLAGDTWKPSLEIIEEILENGYVKFGCDNVEWKDMSFAIKIKCTEKTQEELDDLEG